MVAILAVIAVAIVVILLSLSPLAKQLSPDPRASYPLKYTDEVEQWAEEYDVDPYLVYALIRTESSFQPEAESGVGARGLMQMTSDTFDWVKSKIAPEEVLTFDDLFTPDISVRFGTYFLYRCLDRYSEDVSTAAAAYHSGWGTVDDLLVDREYSEDGLTLHTFPFNQMNHYVNKINQSYEKYLELYTTQ